MWKPKHFKDFQRHSNTKSDEMYKRDQNPLRGKELQRERAEYEKSLEYIKETFKEPEKPSEKTFGKKSITDEQVKYIRDNYCTIGLTKLSQQMNLNKSCVYKCAKGLTFKHLNNKYRPVH